jgi:CheY-like chemotaxis protein
MRLETVFQPVPRPPSAGSQKCRLRPCSLAITSNRGAGARCASHMSDSRPLRLLIVDDHPDTAEATAQLLALHGHETRAARTCAEARAAVGGPAPFVPDVVLLDLLLPDGDGIVLATELCHRLPVRPVLIALTGRPGLEEQCRCAGFDHYLLKPADPEALAELIARGPEANGPKA